MLDEITIRGKFIVDELPKRVRQPLSYLKIKAKIVPTQALELEGLKSYDNKGTD